LINYIDQKRKRSNGVYDCAVAVSGGKDSTAIVRMLFERFGVERALLIHIPKVFTLTKVGRYNLNNLCNRYDVDLITVRSNEDKVKKSMREDFVNHLHPGKKVFEDIHAVPKDICSKFGVEMLFYGENGEYEYGSANELRIKVPADSSSKCTGGVEMLYLGAVVPYSGHGWYEMAKEIGFKDLTDTREWYRQGQIEQFSEIDSFGHAMAVWTKFVKFGVQRTADIASRMVREKRLTLPAAERLVRDLDWVCDPLSREDFCETLNISEKEFWDVVDRHANTDVVKKDEAGNWRRIDFIDGDW